MSEDLLVSIIVPVFNLEKYIYRCADSILAQSYKNFEVIFVDDGSIDSSGEICSDYAKKDKRVRVIHTKNRGAACARNCGIENSQGQYLMFVDADDYIHVDYIKKLLQAMLNNNADIVQCGYYKIYGSNKKICSNYSFEVTGKKVQQFLYGGKYNSEAFDVPWNKLYKKTLFEKERFIAGRLHEDYGTLYRVYYQAHKVIAIPEILYYYLVRTDGFNLSDNLESRIDMMKNEKERWEFYQENDMNWLAAKAMKSYYYRILCCMEDVKLTKEERKYYLQERDYIAKRILKSADYNLKAKIGIIWNQLKNREV